MAWCVKGKYYDLSKFNHPGGPIALGLARGRDADALIREYHPFTEDKVRLILEKYLVEKPEGGPVIAVDKTFNSIETPFAKELKQLARDQFRDGKVRTATPVRCLEYVIMFVILATSTYFTVKGYWLSMLIMPFAYWVMGVNTFHDASHFAVSRNWKVNWIVSYSCPWFSSPLSWYHQHVIGHHPYVNIDGLDPDLTYDLAIYRYAEFHPYNPLHQYQVYLVWIVWVVGVTFQAFISDMKFLARNRFQKVVHAEPISLLSLTSYIQRRRAMIHIAGRLFTLLLVYFWPYLVFSPLKAMAFSLIPVGLYSMCFLTISQVGHVVPETDPIDTTDKPVTNLNFYEHQLAQTHNFGTDSSLCFYLTGGLNLQIEHHLFPGVNHTHLRALAPKVKALCKKHGVPYHESTSGFFEAVWKYLSVVHEMRLPPKSAAVSSKKEM